MSEHTKGLLRVGKGHAVVADHPVPEMRGSDALDYYGGHMVAESVTAANASRIVACWNLLDGYSTEELEGVTLAEFVASHPELAEKLAAMTKRRDALSSALEWTDEQIMEFISMAFRHAQIKGDFELSDVRDALNMIKSRALGGKVCEGCGHTGGGKCPDCGPVMGNKTYQEMFGKGEQS